MNKEFNYQEIFDKVSKHLLTQMKKSENLGVLSKGINYKYCRYRDDDGLMCALGCLIPDDKYSPMLEGTTIYSGNTKNLIKALGYDDLDTSQKFFLDLLQKVHDTREPNEWKKGLSEVADEFKLSTKIFKEV